MKFITKFNNTLFDAAPPLAILMVSAVVLVPLVMLLIGLAAWLVKKARRGSKRNAFIRNTGQSKGEAPVREDNGEK